jgi:hypothetical protein
MASQQAVSMAYHMGLPRAAADLIDRVLQLEQLAASTAALRQVNERVDAIEAAAQAKRK